MSKFFVGQRVRVIKTGLQAVVRETSPLSDGLVAVDFDDRDGEGYYWNDELEQCVCNDHDGNYYCGSHAPRTSMDPEPMPELPPPPFAEATTPFSSDRNPWPLPTNPSDVSARRKNQPVGRGCLDYFPSALLAVSELSRIANEKHNPGEPMHHARGKSMDPEPMPELPPPPLAPAVVPAGYHDRKFDAGKSRMDLLPFEALEAVGDVLAYGCAKYAENSWQQVPDARKRYTAALLRHLAAMQRGEELDEESGHLHAVHMATNALFICWLELQRTAK